MYSTSTSKSSIVVVVFCRAVTTNHHLQNNKLVMKKRKSWTHTRRQTFTPKKIIFNLVSPHAFKRQKQEVHVRSYMTVHRDAFHGISPRRIYAAKDYGSKPED